MDRHPLDAIARAGTSEELPAMRTTEAIDDYDLFYVDIAKICLRKLSTIRN